MAGAKQDAKPSLGFARGVILVEGDAGHFLIPTFAEELNISLDEYGVTVCSVAGTNFQPYVKLLCALGIPFAVITDYDEVDEKPRAYPRGSRVMRWLEQCAMWCCGGWRTGQPRLSRVISGGTRLFHEVIGSDEDRLEFQRAVIAALWDRRDEALGLHDWLTGLREELIRRHIGLGRSLADEAETLDNFIERLGPPGDIDDFPLGEFAGIGSGLDRINLSSLHSAKGRELDVVILCGAEEGRLPSNGAPASEVREARRRFYVGFTRARHEIHLMYGQAIPSRFVTEVRQRLDAE